MHFFFLSFFFFLAQPVHQFSASCSVCLWRRTGRLIPVSLCRQQDLDQNGASGCSWSGCCPKFRIFYGLPAPLGSSSSYSCPLRVFPALHPSFLGWSLHCFHPPWRSACQGFGGMWGFLMAPFHVQVFEMIILLFQWLLDGGTKLLTVPLASFDCLQRCEMDELLLSLRKQVPFIFLASGPPARSQSAADSSVWKKGVCGDAINEAVLSLTTSFMGFMQMSTNLCFMSH